MSTPENTTGPKTLVKKLAEVMSLVGKLPKNGHNTHFNYKFVRESDLVEKLSELLAERQVFIASSTMGIESVELSKLIAKTGQIVTTKMGILRVEYTFHDGESGERLTMEGVGEIDQDGGKGLYKALTGAMKYFLMKNFLVATGDDPEQTPQQRSEPAKKAPPPKKAEKARPTATMVMETLTRCQKLQGLRTVYEAAFKYEWQPDELASINECFLNVYGRLSNWPVHDQLHFFTADNLKVAGIAKDPKTGKLTVVEFGPSEAAVAALADAEVGMNTKSRGQYEADDEAAVAEAERAGMAA